MGRSCWICKTIGSKEKSYFRIPKTLKHRNHRILELSILRKEKWREVLQLPEDTTGIRICSDHFVSGNPARLLDTKDPDWVPTKNLSAKASLFNKTVKPKFKMRLNINTIPATNFESEPDSKSCRFCLKVVQKGFCTDVLRSPNNSTLLRMITAVLGHEVKQSGIPLLACCNCLKKIQICWKLIEFFRNNEKLLMKSTKNEFIENNSNLVPQGEQVECAGMLNGCRTDLKNRSLTEKTLKTFSKSNNFQNSFTSHVEPSKREVPCNDLYDQEQICSIIQDNFASSDAEYPIRNSDTRFKRRKYEVQSIVVRPVEVKTLKCNNCYEKFSDLNSLKLHKNFCKLYYCQLCKPQLTFRYKEEQTFHKKKYHSQALVCHICGKSYSQSYLLKHFRNHFEKEKICPHCGKILKNYTVLMSHIDKIHGNRSVCICEKCGKCYKNRKKHESDCVRSAMTFT